MADTHAFAVVCRVVRVSGGWKHQGGAIRFIDLPVVSTHCYRCEPDGFLSADEAQELAGYVESVPAGTVGRFRDLVWCVERRNDRRTEGATQRPT